MYFDSLRKVFFLVSPVDLVEELMYGLVRSVPDLLDQNDVIAKHYLKYKYEAFSCMSHEQNYSKYPPGIIKGLLKSINNHLSMRCVICHCSTSIDRWK